MTISELISELEAIQEQHGELVEVRLATQPSWPFENSIRSVIGPDDMVNDFDLEEKEPVVYLAEGSHIGYLPGNASSALDW